MDYQIKRARRKTAAIHVTPQGVEVRVPYGVDVNWVDSFVLSKRQWIARQQQKLAQHQQDTPTLAWGEPILFLGQPRTLTFASQSRLAQGKIQIELVEQQLMVSASEKLDLVTLKAALEAWFKAQAKAYIPQLVYARCQQLGVMERLNQIRFRRTKTKWGHCTSTGNLQFNWQIMGASAQVVDYLVCHEVSHLLEHNHSKRFWAHVESLCPDYNQHRQWLKQHGHKLIW